MLNLIPFPYRLTAVAVVMLAAVSGWAWYRHSLIQEGEQRATTRIEDANQAAKEKADEGANTVEECFAAGRDWDRARGMCAPASSGQ